MVAIAQLGVILEVKSGSRDDGLVLDMGTRDIAQLVHLIQFLGSDIPHFKTNDRLHLT